MGIYGRIPNVNMILNTQCSDDRLRDSLHILEGQMNVPLDKKVMDKALKLFL